MQSRRFKNGGPRTPPAIDLGRAKVGAVEPPASAYRVFDEYCGHSGRYPGDPLGMPSLRERFRKVLETMTGWAPPIENIAVIDRSSEIAIAFFFETMLAGERDELLSWKPQWFGYSELLPDGQRRPEYTTMPLREVRQYRPSVRALKQHLTPDVAAVIVPDLINPLGVRVSDDRLLSIFNAICEGSEAMVLHDLHFLFNVEHPNRSVRTLCPRLWDENRYVGITSLRLGFALPEHRNVAFCWGPRPLMLALGEFLRLKKFRSDIPHQLLALACLEEEGLETPKVIRRACDTNRELLDEWLQRFPELSLVTPYEDGPHLALDLEKAVSGMPGPRLMRDALFVFGLIRRKQLTLLAASQFGLETSGVRINLSGTGEAGFKDALRRLASYIRGGIS